MSLVQPPPVRPAEAPPSPPPAPVGSARATTSADVDAMRAMRSELSDQLTSAARRRAELVEQLPGADAFARQGLEARIRVLDERIVNIEQQIAITGRDLAETISSAREPVGPVGGISEETFSVLAGLGIVFVLFPIALSVSRLLWRRARVQPPERNPATDARLERIEQAVDAIAIEVERISEAQRYSAKLLSQGPAIPIGELDERRPVEVPASPERAVVA